MQCIEYMYKGKQIYRKGKEKKKIFRISAGVFPRHACFKTIPKMAAVLDTPLEKLITQAVCPPPPPHTHSNAFRSSFKTLHTHHRKKMQILCLLIGEKYVSSCHIP